MTPAHRGELQGGIGHVLFAAAGPLALGCREPGQVGNEAATAKCLRCRGQGSPS